MISFMETIDANLKTGCIDPTNQRICILLFCGTITIIVEELVKLLDDR